jgi:hypothetical protein
MTTPNVVDVSTLPAGRELDALVAERVMGMVWRHSDSPPAGFRSPRMYDTPWRWLIPSDNAYPRATGDEKPYLENIPHYSTDIAAAFQVVEKLRADDYQVIVVCEPVGEKRQFSCEIARLSDRGSDVETGDTAPLAICHAALRATTPPGR